jgi:hypothetical protein
MLLTWIFDKFKYFDIVCMDLFNLYIGKLRKTSNEIQALLNQLKNLIGANIVISCFDKETIGLAIRGCISDKAFMQLIYADNYYHYTDANVWYSRISSAIETDQKGIFQLIADCLRHYGINIEYDPKHLELCIKHLSWECMEYISCYTFCGNQPIIPAEVDMLNLDSKYIYLLLKSGAKLSNNNMLVQLYIKSLDDKFVASGLMKSPIYSDGHISWLSQTARGRAVISALMK